MCFEQPTHYRDADYPSASRTQELYGGVTAKRMKKQQFFFAKKNQKTLFYQKKGKNRSGIMHMPTRSPAHPAQHPTTTAKRPPPGNPTRDK
ncbi:MAG: hypothetical protein POG24_12030, partial [Acidocella sp.]|nr:hypothetical protein [Acidocella sp.]